MTDTVYVLGAGINRGITDIHGARPPLDGDFFSEVLKHKEFGGEMYRAKIRPLLEYIQRHWKLTPSDLLITPLSLEECYTVLQLQTVEAKKAGHTGEYVRLMEINDKLTRMFAEYLESFEGPALSSSDSFGKFGRALYAHRPTIISFNYDTLLEFSIESASGIADRPASYRARHLTPDAQVADDELPFSHHNWNRALAYGFGFDNIQLHRPGVPTFVPGSRFYTHQQNKLYPSPILKLHGSVNWFRHTGDRRSDSTYGPFNPLANLDSIGLYSHRRWFNEPVDLQSELLDSVIVTPVLQKVIDGKPFQALWDRAREELRGCQRLVVGGYSFPPMDFHTRRLFIEAFSERSPAEVIIINPDTSVIALIKRLCNFQKPVIACKNLDEYIAMFYPTDPWRW